MLLKNSTLILTPLSRWVVVVVLQPCTSRSSRRTDGLNLGARPSSGSQKKIIFGEWGPQKYRGEKSMRNAIKPKFRTPKKKLFRDSVNGSLVKAYSIE